MICMTYIKKKNKKKYFYQVVTILCKSYNFTYTVAYIHTETSILSTAAGSLNIKW